MVLQRYACEVPGPDAEPCEGTDTGDTGLPDTGQEDTGRDTAVDSGDSEPDTAETDTDESATPDTGTPGQENHGGGYWGGCQSRPLGGTVALVLLPLLLVPSRRRIQP